jgi:hypothetical protein
MGIDIYLRWEGQWEPPADDFSKETLQRWGEEYNQPGVYLRENYFSGPHKATMEFVPETFLGGVPFAGDGRPMVHPAGWPEGVTLCNGGVHYPWTVLAGRIEAVTKASLARYADDLDYAKAHIDNFMAFVRKVRELEEAGINSWVENSY